MSSWDDPDHLKPGRQTQRLQAWRDEDRIWVYRTRVSLMQRFADHPGRFMLGAILLMLVFVTPLTLLSVRVGLSPLTLPGGAVTLLTGAGITVRQVHRRAHTRQPSPLPSKGTSDDDS